MLNSRAVFQTEWIFCRPVFKSHKTNEKWPTAPRSSWLQPPRGQMAQLAPAFASSHQLGGKKRAIGGDYRDRTVGLGAETSAWRPGWSKQDGVWHFAELQPLVFVTFCSPLRKANRVIMPGGQNSVVLARLHVKYRSLVPEFLWHGPGSLRHFIYLMLAACGFPDLFLYLLFHLSDHAVQNRRRIKAPMKTP